MKNKVLYIHGFNDSPNGTTGNLVKSFFADDIVVAPSFDYSIMKELCQK